MGGAVLMYRPFHPSNPFQYSIVSTYLSLKWSDYAIILFLSLLVFWLGLLTWLIYHHFAFTNRKYRDLMIRYHNLMSRFDVLEKSIVDLVESTGRQGLALERVNRLADDLANDRATNENTISNLNQSARDSGERLLNFHASYQAQSESLSQEPSFVEELQALQKQAGESLAKIKIADPASSLNFAPAQVAASQPAYKLQTLEDLVASMVIEYQTAFSRCDRPALRSMTSDQLNITQSSEVSLMGTSVPPTQLEVVKNGGTYLLVHRYDRHWLVPEFLILSSFTTVQPNKGIFAYQRENISTAELRWPAEVKEINGLWEVISMGIIAVPF
jgi:hypothetical protein